jgi:hypothetical protein
MSTIQEMKPCHKGEKVTMHLGQKPNHLLHLILSLITVGLWLIIWAILSAFAKYQCSLCGNIRRS